jgi:hypothetical protein
MSSVQKGTQVPGFGYFEGATERSWFGGRYGNPTETCKEQVSKTETVVCRPNFAGAFATENGPVPVSDIVKAFQSSDGFRFDLQKKKVGSPRSSQFEYRSRRFYLVGYGGYKCERALFWSMLPSKRAATFCDKDTFFLLLTDFGRIDFFPLTDASARFSSQVVAVV